MVESEQRLLMLIDDEPAQSRLIASLASREGWRTLLIREAGSAVSMLTRRDDNDPGAVCLDLTGAGEDAGIVIAELRSRRPTLPLIVVAERDDGGRGIEALRAGATDFLLKPVTPEALVRALRNAMRRHMWGDELAPLAEKSAARIAFQDMIGSSQPFRNAIAAAVKVARGPRPVLIEGEPGTGKESVARAIHAAGTRAGAPLRIVNAGCTAANSMGSLLFGHEKDAFPGAFDQRPGALQQCDGGTVVIDEIESLTLPLQARLLEFLTRGGVRPIGAQYSYRVNVRLIVTSDVNLRDKVAAGLFDPELLQAIGPAAVTLPPLRERGNDIAELAQYVLARIGACKSLPALDISEEATRLLAAYDWPGNVRQLAATLFRAVVFARGDTLTSEDFPTLSAQVGSEDASASPRPPAGTPEVILYTQDGNVRPLEEIESDIIRLAISLYRGRMTEVARRLGIGRSTLYRKLNELGIDNAA